MDISRKSLKTQLPGEIPASTGSFSSEAPALLFAMNVVTDFKVTSATDVLPGEPAITQEFAAVRFDDPEAEPILGIALPVSLNPGSGLVSALDLRVISHHLRVTQKPRQHVEIRHGHLPETQAFSGFG